MTTALSELKEIKPLYAPSCRCDVSSSNVVQYARDDCCYPSPGPLVSSPGFPPCWLSVSRRSHAAITVGLITRSACLAHFSCLSLAFVSTTRPFPTVLFFLLLPCIKPPLYAVPEGDWFCPTCVQRVTIWAGEVGNVEQRRRKRETERE